MKKTALGSRYGIVLLFFLYSIYSKGIAQSEWSLKQCIDTALHNNLTILQSENTVALNGVLLEQSKYNRLPNLNANAGESFNSGRSLNPVSYQFTTGNIWSNNFSLNSSVNLFNGLQNFNTIQQNKLNVLSSQYDLETLKNDISLSVVNSYMQVLFSKELVKIATNQLNGTQQQYEKTEKFVAVGKKSENDLLQLNSQLASDKLSLINAQGQLKSNRLALQQLMNVAFSAEFEIQSPPNLEPNVIELTNSTETFNQALSTQPTIKSSVLKTQRVEYSIKMAKGAVFPKLTLSGNLNTNYSSASKLLSATYINYVQPIGYLKSNSSETVLASNRIPVYSSSNYLFQNQVRDNLSKTVSVTLAVPIFNNFTVRNNIQKQKINLSNAKINETIAQYNLRKSIEQAYVDAGNSLAKLTATNEQVNATFSSYQNSTARYDNGMMTATDYLLEKNRYVKAQSRSHTSKIRINISP